MGQAGVGRLLDLGEKTHTCRTGSRSKQLELLHMAGRNVNWYSSTLRKCLTAAAKAEHAHT